MPFAVKTTRAGGVFILKPDTNRQSPVLSKTAEINKKTPTRRRVFFYWLRLPDSNRRPIG